MSGINGGGVRATTGDVYREGVVSILIGILTNAAGFCLLTPESQLPFKWNHSS